MREVAAHFDRVAPGYEDLRSRGWIGRWRSRETQAVAGLAEIEAGDLVLDAGCGSGTWLQWCAHRGARALGVDLSRQMARMCRGRGLEVAVADFASLPFRPVFDRVLCVGSLEFTSKPEAALASLAGALRPGGRLVLLYPRLSAAGVLYVAYHRMHGVRVRLFRAREIDGMLKSAGLEPHGAHSVCGLSAACAAVRRG